jgi:hypothetical protein
MTSLVIHWLLLLTSQYNITTPNSTTIAFSIAIDRSAHHNLTFKMIHVSQTTLVLSLLLFLQQERQNAVGFSVGSTTRAKSRSTTTTTMASTTQLFLRTNVKVPLLDVLGDDSEEAKQMITPLPSSHLPAEMATPCLYGMQVERPIHKLLLEEAHDLRENPTDPPTYGHLVWKSGDSLVGAIGCTAEILVHAPTTEVMNPEIAQDLKTADAGASSAVQSETPPSTALCRGGYRFVVKEVLRSIPYPVVLIDEIQDDAEDNDSEMFASVTSGDGGDDDDDDDDEDNDEQYINLSARELIQRTMIGIQSVVSQNLEEVNSKQMSPLEQSILEESGAAINPNAMELMQAEEMAAVWDVFQASLVDDISPKDRKYAIALMAAELADMKNEVRRKILLTRDSQERLRIVLQELDEMVGMARARKMASQITDKDDDTNRDLKVGQPQLPGWAKSIVKGTKVEYFWNEKYGWVAGEVMEVPVTVVDEILLTIRFDDGETHTLPLTADDKVRWRPPA